MASITKGRYLMFNPNTVYEVRKEYNLHKPGAMDQAIDILNDWITKQEHFVKKDLPRDYLERHIISAKGSLEKAKKRIDKLYTMQTLNPELFEKCNAIKDFPNLRNFFVNAVMPIMTEDYCRVLIAKVMVKTVTAEGCFETYQHCRIICEYGKLNDYAKGYYLIVDIRDLNIPDALSNVDWVQFRIGLTALIEGYGFKLMSIYVMSSSTMVNTLLKLIKSFLSEKLAKRINVVKNVESLYEFLPRKVLPKDYGGEQRSILELYDELNKTLSSEEIVAHMEEMRRARTREELRSSQSFDEEYLGMPGSFKMLNVD